MRTVLHTMNRVASVVNTFVNSSELTEFSKQPFAISVSGVPTEFLNFFDF